MPGNILTINIGLSSVKVSLYSAEGKCLADYEQQCPPRLDNERAEQDPEQWWGAVCSLTRKLTTEHAEQSAGIDIIGLTGTMRSIVLVDRNSNALGPAILLRDRRARDEHEQISRELSVERIQSLSGSRLSPGSVLARLRWLANNEPDRLKAARYILAPKDYVRLRLTGLPATDPTDAAGLQLYSLRENDWHDALCACAGVRPEQLPTVRPSTEVSGRLNAVKAMTLGLRSGIPVVVGAGDDAAFLASGICSSEDAAEHLAGSGAMRALVDKLVVDPHGGLETAPSPLQGYFVVSGTLLTAGLAVEWFARNSSFGSELVDDPARLSALIAEVSARGEPGEVFFFPHMVGECSPEWAPGTRGAFMGLDPSHTALDMLGGVLEGMTYAMNAILAAMQNLGLKPQRICTQGKFGEDAGAARLRASVYAKPIVCFDKVDPVSFSAMLIAGTACGAFEDPLQANKKLRETIWQTEPSPEAVESYRIGYQRYCVALNDLNKLWNPQGAD